MEPVPGSTEPDTVQPRPVMCAPTRPLHLTFHERLHAGALTDVWRATLPSGRPVAVKAVNRCGTRHAAVVQLLRREHRALTALSHPHVVDVVGWVDSPRCTGIALEFLGCGDLVSMAGSDPRHWLGPARDIVAALGHVHASGYVHGDLKARNVLFGSSRHAKLVDFGSALPIGAPLHRGGRTSEHWPPSGGSVHAAAAIGTTARPALDVYALAVLLYELLAGRLPFPADGAVCPAGPLRPPLTAAAAAAAGVEALVERVMTTLTSLGAGAGTLVDFGNVLESVPTRPSRPDSTGPSISNRT